MQSSLSLKRILWFCSNSKTVWNKLIKPTELARETLVCSQTRVRSHPLNDQKEKKIILGVKQTMIYIIFWWYKSNEKKGDSLLISPLHSIFYQKHTEILNNIWVVKSTGWVQTECNVIIKVALSLPRILIIKWTCSHFCMKINNKVWRGILSDIIIVPNLVLKWSFPGI